MEGLPVVVIGAGPVGLDAALHLGARGVPYLLLERGPAVGTSIREWAHVRLFSPWRHLVDPLAAELLGVEGWTAPSPELIPTGGDLVNRLCEPLARHPLVAPHLRLEHRVVRIGRAGFDKVRSRGREEAPFEIMVETAEGRRRILARAVIDASGTWGSPNPMGAGGVPAEGEEAFGRKIRVGIPDVRGAERERYAGRRVAVVGSGHSAFNALLDLVRLEREVPGGEIHWVIRGPLRPQLFGGGGGDELPARGLLGVRLHQAVHDGKIEVASDFRVAAIEEAGEGGAGPVRLVALDGRVLEPLDEVIVATGFRPDLVPTRELRLALDETLECPVALAPLIDPNEHSCGTVSPHGFRELGHSERDFYTVGMKSYGRAPTFLLLTGYEQVRSVVAALAGDEEAAVRVALTLPETGVCGTGGGCC